MTTTEIDIPARICVRSPYFALSDVQVVKPGIITANVPVETPPITHEPISMPEAIRHGAILGLCSVASLAPDSDRRYYLAQTGTVTWLTEPAELPTDTPLTGRGQGELTSNRAGAAEGTIYAGHSPVARVHTTFAVINVKAFARMFKHLNRPVHTGRKHPASPYKEGLTLHGMTIHEEHQSATATVTANVEQCAGHFDGYPAMPVAVVIRAGIELAGHLVNSLDRKRWRMQDGHLHPVSKLIPAGEPVYLTAQLIHDTPFSRLTRVSLATSADGEIGYCTFSFVPTR